ncbi:MAG: penicillin-binding protein 2 [Candidatus Magasanikbacteria bacterium]|nr:penicillin-binding protein 2 [Candidatus Magasanikbacteria bacterium]
MAKIANSNQVNGRYRKRWVEESFPGALVTHRAVRTLDTSLNRRPQRWLLAILALLLFLLIGRTIQLQLLRGGHYRQLAETNRLRLRSIPAERGIIFDRAGKALVENIPNFSLSIIPHNLPRRLPERQQLLERLAAITGVSPTEITNQLETWRSYSFETIILKENLDYQTALKLYLESAELPGVLITTGSRRAYPAASRTPSLSHLLGYLAKITPAELAADSAAPYQPTDTVGRAGLERQYESVLRGSPGRKKIEVNALGREQAVLATEPPEPGRHLRLTIDQLAQTELENQARKQYKPGRQRVAAVALNPQTGAILALVSLPAFNNNDFSGAVTNDVYTRYLADPDQPFFNRALAGQYAPGSTVKLIIAAAAWAERIVRADTTIISTGFVRAGDRIFRDWLAGGHGPSNLTRALAWSINTFFYYIGGGHENFPGLGITKLRHYLQLFGLGEPTGIDLPGEAAGFIPSPEWKKQTKQESWYIGDTYNLSIGQGDILVTPLQVARWTAAVANGGNLITPHLVQEITDPVRKTTERTAWQTKPLALPGGSITAVQTGMRACVTVGSCQALQTLPFASAGKTGTAQWHSQEPTHAWFTAYAPYQNPAIVITVLVERGGEGASAALPIARNWLAWWSRHYAKDFTDSR